MSEQLRRLIVRAFSVADGDGLIYGDEYPMAKEYLVSIGIDPGDADKVLSVSREAHNR